MIVEKIWGHVTENDRITDKVYIDWFECDKKLLRKISEKGVEIGIRVNEVLKDGDVLYHDEISLIVVEINPTELIKIHVSNIIEMGKVCFEIGNRHLSPSIKEDCVRIPYDEPTFAYLIKLGYQVEKVTEKFTDYTICRGHSHSDENAPKHIHVNGRGHHHHHG